MEPKNIPDWLERVKKEHYELTTKLINLTSFIETRSEFRLLPHDEQSMLLIQRDIMVSYSRVLVARAKKAGLSLDAFRF